MSKFSIKNLRISKKNLSILVASTLALNMAPIVNHLNTKAESKNESFIMQNDYVETTSKINMRLDDSLYGEIICKIEKDEELKRILTCNDWDLVIYKDKIGFVSGAYTTDISDSTGDLKIKQEAGYISATTKINLRLGPSIDDKVIGGIDINAIAEVLGKTNDNWYLVLYNGKIGYVSGEYVEYKDNLNFNQGADGKLYGYASANVNFRKEPTKNSEKKELLKKGTQVEILSQEDNGWFKVIYNGKEGYINDDYITFNPEDGYRKDFIKVVYATDDIELKNQQSEDSFLLYTLSKYETCEVLAETTDKYFVRCAGNIGYIPKEKTAGLYNTFIVVDISSQKLTLYRNNEILVETDIVTGQRYEHDTPTGMYSIKKKETDTFLTGEDYYTHVDYWMPFNGGIGLHDADWRSKFGGTIYERNGSHGCINIPPKYADDVYENVDKGTKVLVQK